MFGFLRERRRNEVRSQPFPDAWDAILRRRFGLYDRLPAALREELRRRVLVFVDEKNFEGAGGLEIDDEVRVVIAAQACLLTLAREDDPYYPRLRSIIVYPASYQGAAVRRGAIDGSLSEGVEHRLGESWQTGSVVLSWASVAEGGENPRDGHNVVLHEFAHQLDQEDGSSDGAPVLGADLPGGERRERYHRWAIVMRREFDRLEQRVEHGERTLLDDYGATNPAEFFAVATETFFEKAARMRRERPELYRELADYYRLDPADWSEPKPS